MGTILVTAGFIGSHVAEVLLENNQTVICVDNLNDFYNPKQKYENLSLLQRNKNFIFYKGDICDNKCIEKIFSENKIDKIVHIAARAGVRQSIENPASYIETNVIGTINLLNHAAKYKCQKFVFASSSSVYGEKTTFPLRETELNLMPCSPYAITKYNAEQFCSFYAETYKLPIVVLRFFTVYGPRGRPDMATYRFIEAILHNQDVEIYGDGTTERDFTYVKDTVAGICSALNVDVDFEIINLGFGMPVNLKKYVMTIASIIGKQPTIIYKEKNKLDMNKTYADIEKAKRILKFTPQFSIEEGLKETVEWHRERKKSLSIWGEETYEDIL